MESVHLLNIGIVVSTANTLYVQFLLCFDLYISIAWAIMNLGYLVTFSTPALPPKAFDDISGSDGNISLTWSVINISHSASLSEPIRLVSEDLRALGGRYLVSGVKPVNSNQPPNPLPILINADNLSFEYPNQWSMARSTCRQLLPVTNWKEVVYEQRAWRLRRREC